MRDKIWTICAMALLAGCGVNPDRLATMHEKNAAMSEDSNGAATGKSKSSAVALKVEDSDPAEVRDAVMMLQDLEKLAEQKQYAEYLAKRYELLKRVTWEASKTMATSPKSPQIVSRVYDLDAEIAEFAGGRAETAFGTVGRSENASVDARYALNDAFVACADAVKALGAGDSAAHQQAWGKYESGLARANAIDAKSMTYVGKNVNATGYFDVPAEMVICEARAKIAKAKAEDAPPVAVNKERTFQGCGVYPIELEAKQTGTNQFGDYLITSAYVADQDPGIATPVDCGVIPPVSDADSDVQKTIKDFVAWLQPTDIISMSGRFRYEGSEGQKLKLGTAQVYRRQANLKSNACGENDPKVTCEAEGSMLAKAYNHGKHYFLRATSHRSAGSADRCERMLDFAIKASNVTSPEGKDKQFLLADGRKLSREELVKELENMKAKGTKALSANWCDTQ